MLRPLRCPLKIIPSSHQKTLLQDLRHKRAVKRVGLSHYIFVLFHLQFQDLIICSRPLCLTEGGAAIQSPGCSQPDGRRTHTRYFETGNVHRSACKRGGSSQPAPTSLPLSLSPTRPLLPVLVSAGKELIFLPVAAVVWI